MLTTAGAAFSTAVTTAVRRVSERFAAAEGALAGDGACVAAGAAAARAAPHRIKAMDFSIFIIRIADLLQAQALGRRPRPLSAIGPGQDVLGQAPRTRAARHVEARAHDGAHHLVKEAVG